MDDLLAHAVLISHSQTFFSSTHAGYLAISSSLGMMDLCSRGSSTLVTIFIDVQLSHRLYSLIVFYTVYGIAKITTNKQSPAKTKDA